MNQHVKPNDAKTKPFWYAVETKPAAEYIAEVEMRRVGINVYLPQYRREYRHHRSKAWIARQFPLFPGYIFIRGDSLDWGALGTCKGIERNPVPVLRDANGKTVPIANEAVAKIILKEESGAFDELRGASSRLRVGQAVRIDEGPLAGLEGPLSRVKSQKNVQLLISLFNTEVAASVPVAMITKKD